MLRWGRREELILGEDREGTVVKNEGKFSFLVEERKVIHCGRREELIQGGEREKCSFLKKEKRIGETEGCSFVEGVKR